MVVLMDAPAKEQSPRCPLRLPNRSIALVCCNTCGVTFLSRRDGQRWAAAVAYFPTSHSTASVLSGPPRRLGNSGSPGLPARFVDVHAGSLPSDQGMHSKAVSQIMYPRVHRGGAGADRDRDLPERLPHAATVEGGAGA